MTLNKTRLVKAIGLAVGTVLALAFVTASIDWLVYTFGGEIVFTLVLIIFGMAGLIAIAYGILTDLEEWKDNTP
jgi:hypothetical protein